VLSFNVNAGQRGALHGFGRFVSCCKEVLGVQVNGAGEWATNVSALVKHG
jgi:hypothetical protein